MSLSPFAVVAAVLAACAVHSALLAFDVGHRAPLTAVAFVAAVLAAAGLLSAAP